jgi:hypothetical protein
MTSESKGVSPEARAVRRYTILPWTEDGVSRMVAEEDFDALARTVEELRAELAEAKSMARAALSLLDEANQERGELRHECARLGAKVSGLDGLLDTTLDERDQAKQERDFAREQNAVMLQNEIYALTRHEAELREARAAFEGLQAVVSLLPLSTNSFEHYGILRNAVVAAIKGSKP